VGHPLADQIDADTNPAAARIRLGLDPARPAVALLPGSRESEVSRLAGPMLEAASLLRESHPEMQFVAAMAGAHIDRLFCEEAERTGLDSVRRIQGDPRGVIAAADVVLCASGTATLEVMLVNRPMVMTYRLAPSTYRLGKALRLVRLEWFSLPNILARERLVPELIQDEANGPGLAAEARRWLSDEDARRALKSRFDEMHATLRRDAAARAADAVAALAGAPP
jgi:lipid-A-disaccharide synthase